MLCIIQQNVSGQIKRREEEWRRTFEPGREGLCGGEEGVMGRVMKCRRLARCVSTMVWGRSISGLTREKGSKRPRHLVLSLCI